MAPGALGSYVDGAWYHPKGETLQDLNPADPREVVAEFPAAGAADVERAVAGALRAQVAWRETPAPERGRVVWRAVEVARRRADEIARTLTREEGKILREARGEVFKGINVLEYYAGEGFRIQGRTLPSEIRDTFTCTIRRPLGVVGLITPWNFPWAIPCWKVAPALVAGNTCVLKPSEVTPATAALLVECFAEAGLPPGCLQVLNGPGETVGAAMVEHPALRAISFTGSNAVGLAIYERCARRGAKVTCEMGGKNAVVVLEDADLDLVLKGVLNGAFGSTGQRCTATSRVLVHESLRARLTEALVEGARAMVVGPGLDEASQMGPAVDEAQLAQDLRYIELAKAEGARLLTGGGRVGRLEPGYFVEPTVFADVSPSSRLFREEVFGPVLGITPVKDLSDALAKANAVPFGLTASIYTRDVARALRFVEECEVGMVHVNEPTIGGEAQLPFGGIKATGVGEREMSTEGLNFFTETKTVFMNYSGSSERAFVR